MADQVFAFTPTIPAGTPIATPYTLQMPMPACVVVSIGILVPPGPRGNMGFAIGSSGVAVIPAAPNTWFVVDDFADDWPLEHQISSGGWEFFGYNLGQYAHSVYLRFAVMYPNLVGAVQPAALDFASISNQPSQPSPTGT